MRTSKGNLHRVDLVTGPSRAIPIAGKRKGSYIDGETSPSITVEDGPNSIIMVLYCFYADNKLKSDLLFPSFLVFVGPRS